MTTIAHGRAHASGSGGARPRSLPPSKPVVEPAGGRVPAAPANPGQTPQNKQAPVVSSGPLGPTSLDTSEQVGKRQKRAARSAAGAPGSVKGSRKQAPRKADARDPAQALAWKHDRALAARFRAALASADAHDDSGLWLEAAAIRGCRCTWKRLVHTPCGEAGDPVSAISCGDRIGCPLCSHQRGCRVAERLEELFDAVKVRRPKFVTLTVRNLVGREALRGAELSGLIASFARWRVLVERHMAPLERNPATGRLKRGASPLRGGVYALEITYHAAGSTRWHKETDDDGRPTGKLVDVGVYESDEWHPHLHALIDSDYLPQATLANLWEEVTGSRIVDIRAVKGGVREGITELAKYATKILTVEGPPVVRDPETGRRTSVDAEGKRPALVILRDVLKGRRLVAPFGSMHGVEMEEDDDHEDDEADPVCTCGQHGEFVEVFELVSPTEARRIMCAIAEAQRKEKARAGP